MAVFSAGNHMLPTETAATFGVLRGFDWAYFALPLLRQIYIKGKNAIFTITCDSDDTANITRSIQTP